MSLDQQIYGHSDWRLPSPSSTPKSATFPDAAFQTPKAESVPQSHFLDAWSTPRVNGHQTPAQTPSFTISTPIDRPSSSYSQKLPSPEDPQFHVNHFARSTLPLPPVEPARRLSSSPGPQMVTRTGNTLRQNPNIRPRPVSMDTSQMQTPPPTRDATSRRGLQQSGGNEFATPATVIARTPTQMPGFNQTPFGFPALQFSPDMVQFPSTGPMSAPPLPHSRLFWDQPNDPNNMDVDMPIPSDPFGPTPHKIENHFNWQTPALQTPGNQMNPQAFHALHGMSSPGPITSFASSNGVGGNSRPNSFISSEGVDPSMLFSFSSPGPSTSFNMPMPQHHMNTENRQPYELQLHDALREKQEKEAAKMAKGQHSRTSTSSSNASFDNTRPSLQRSNTDSGFRKIRPSSMASMDSRMSGSSAGHVIPRRSSPLKRQSGGSLVSIPEIRRPRTRLVIDENGTARTETVPMDDDEPPRREPSKEAPKDYRSQYPGLFNDDESESESDDPPTLSRTASFSMPQRRVSKHARADSGNLERSNSFKVPRPASGIFEKASFGTLRPVRRAADNPNRRFSMMDFPTSISDIKDKDEQMPDSPGDALGALKKVVEGRQKRIEHASQNTLKAHNQRWAQASADLANANVISNGLYDPFSNSFSGSPANATDASFTTPSTDRSSLSGDSTRCLCNGSDDGRPMVQCESCNKWLHMGCVGLNHQNLPPVYVCIFCTGQTPIARGGRVRGPIPAFDSPLTHKSVFRRQ
ncbi:hypothetical protein P154DRAFT_585534 [Amniculicola lignicola CBS 123094]|uniref:PHD-type domain-containing protein n=1 Tax=Amniculicola lignicola CBS 123094 TaxID=1392246 RepID=A0A6A5W0Y0_9PLEO|nr:hypothetical protein P154DRAFT_585534 [Amniculicola lignicola CBS 123094]